MMTWKLWQMLKVPPGGDPIFNLTTRKFPSQGRWLQYLDIISSLVVITVVIAYLRASLLSLSSGLSPVVLFVGFIILGGTLHGGDWALSSSSAGKSKQHA
jgi:hypothetical protein